MSRRAARAGGGDRDALVIGNLECGARCEIFSAPSRAPFFPRASTLFQLLRFTLRFRDGSIADQCSAAVCAPYSIISSGWGEQPIWCRQFLVPIA
jgi:hypothetical protein